MYTIKTSSKINIGLTVIEKLNNGYHEIETIMIPLGIYDTIEVSFSLNNSNKRLSVEGDFNIPTNKENVVWKVINFVESIINRKIGFDIKIKKVIPVGAGLGGGSGNAAGVLKCLLDFLKLEGGISEKLESLIISNIHKIGADIPFFLSNGAKIAQGIGENLTHLPSLVERLSNYKVVVVYPNISVSTREAYMFIDNNKLMDRNRWAWNFYEGFMRGEIKIEDFEKMLKNSFESFIISKVNEIKGLFYSENAMFALMSGSGSALYGLFDDRVNINRLKEKLIRDLLIPDKFVYEAKFVNETYLFFTGGIL